MTPPEKSQHWHVQILREGQATDKLCVDSLATSLVEIGNAENVFQVHASRLHHRQGGANCLSCRRVESPIPGGITIDRGITRPAI